MRRLVVSFTIIFFVSGWWGCSSSRMSHREPDRLFMEGRFNEAAQRLEEDLKKAGGEKSADYLLYLLDIGLARHAAGEYEESNRVLLQADRLAEIKDYTSLSEEAGTLLTSENVKDYRAEDFENVLINVYLAMNFALLGKTEDAMIEARRVNRKLYLMVSEGKRNYKQNIFAHYLIALMYEMQDDDDNAFISYKKVFEIDPTLGFLKKDLARLALRAGRQDEIERFIKEGVLSRDDVGEAKKELKKQKNQGELIVLFQNGLSPIKRPHPSFHKVPKFFPRYNPVSALEIYVGEQKTAETLVLEDIEQTAIQNLDEKYAGLIAKRVGGVVVKEVVAEGVEQATDSPVVGLLTRIALHASDQADIRSWNLLPKSLQMARVWLEPGEHALRLQTQGVDKKHEAKVTIKKGQKAWLNWRYIP